MNKPDEQWDETVEEEFISVDVPPQYRNLVVDQRQLSIRDIWSRYLSGQLILEPGFQRHYVWDKQRASRFVESLLLGLPIPPIFVAENPDGTWDIIDGHQRLESLFRFMQPLLVGPSGPEWPKAKAKMSLSPLTLMGCEVLHNLNGRGVTELDMSERERLWDRNLNTISIAKDSHPDMKFVLFERLNLGSMSLNPQELRNCLYRGPYNKLIAQLAEDPRVLATFGKSQPDKRMKDRERILRFLALAHRMEAYRTPFRSFLNDEMVANQHASREAISEYKKEFEDALEWTLRVFGQQAFRIFRVGSSGNPNGFWDNRRFKLLYGLELVGFNRVCDTLESVWSRLSTNSGKESFISGIRRRLAYVMMNERFLETLSQNTTSPHMMHRRFELWLEVLQRAVGAWESVIEEVDEVVALQRKSTACQLCPGQISAVEDASLVQRDGGTGLAHTYCYRNRLLGAL